jgi:nucleoside phosphorylase
MEVINGYLQRLPEERWQRVIGIFACSDELALGACDALETYTRAQVSKLKKVPVFKLGVIGFDGISDVRRLIRYKMDPWLINTVQIPIDRIARALSSTIDKMFSHPETPIGTSPKTEPCNLYKQLADQVSYGELTSRRSTWIRTIRPSSPVVLVITARTDEQRAVNDLIGPIHTFEGHSRTYAVGEVLDEYGEKILVATVKTLGQGPTYAQATANEAIEELRPKIIALVGICGAVPSEDFSLGDVVGCTRFLDYSVGAHLPDGMHQAAGQGAQMDHNVRVMLDNAETFDGIIDWSAFTEKRPTVVIGDDKNYYGEPLDIVNTRRTLQIKFGPDGSKDGERRFVTGPTVTDASLAKNTEIMKGWQNYARDMKSIEMEIGGVYQAAVRPGYIYPILAVRGISDVVGFRRDPEWTGYACKSAAFVFNCLLRKGGAPLQRMLSRQQPGID